MDRCMGGQSKKPTNVAVKRQGMTPCPLVHSSAEGFFTVTESGERTSLCPFL